MPLEAAERDFRRGRMSIRLLLALVTINVAGFSVICARTLVDMRHDAFAMALQADANLAATIDADITRNIELYDLSLRAVASYAVMPEVEKLDPAMRQLVLFDYAATAKHFGAIKVLDPNGNVYIDSTTIEPVPENDSDADYFRAHLGGADSGLFIGPPATDARGEYAIPLSRRISRADGSFAGVVAGSIKIKYFHDLFRKLSLESGDSIILFNRDGVIIMRLPFDIDYIGRSIGGTAAVREVLARETGWLQDESPLDGTTRLFSWQRGTSPLVVVTGRSLERIYGPWRDRAIVIALAMAVLIAMMAGVSWGLVREMRRRAVLQRKLAALAITDGLTGLANRRQFDYVIHQEWRRAAREHQPLSLLMVDIDHFKVFNDTYGHQEGDRVLALIAATIAGALHRAGDCAARYGGEEFAVILPRLADFEAHAVAEKIRKAVAAIADVPHPVSVSVGVASVTLPATSDIEDLIRSADAALYLAKANGRNQTVVAGAAALMGVERDSKASAA